MPSPRVAAPSPVQVGRGGPRRIVAALAVTQTVGYGVLYYAFGALLGPMSRDLGITTATASGALTLAVLTSGVMSIPVGRWLDARGGHALMTAGSLLGAAAIATWSQVQTAPQLYAVFALIGIASAMVLYEPAFAVIIAVTAPESRATALLNVTLVAGFASSIFIPLTGRLLAVTSWRTTLLILAAGFAVLTLPLHGFALRRTGPGGRTKAPISAGRALKDPGFWLLAGGFVLHSAAMATIAVHLVLFLTTLGHRATTAAALAGLLGLLSVTGRFVTTIALKWLPMATIAALIFVIQGAAISVLPLVGRQLTGAIICLTLFGLGFGVASIATPAILLDRYGAGGYATIAGTLATPVIVARATAPLAAALLAGTTGYRPVLLAVAASCLTAAVLITSSVRPWYRSQRCPTW